MEQFFNEILNDQAKLIFVVVSVMVISEVGVGIFMFKRAKDFLNGAVVLMAEITEVDQRTTDKGGQYSRLKINYKDELGQMHEGEVSLSGHNHEVGGKVEILYNHNYPGKVKSNNKMHIFIVPLAMMAGAVALVVGLVVMVVHGTVKLPF